MLKLHLQKSIIFLIASLFFSTISMTAFAETNDVMTNGWLENQLRNSFAWDENIFSGVDPVYFTGDINNDGKKEIFILGGIEQGAPHAYSKIFLISYPNNVPTFNTYSGDKFYGINFSTGIFATGNIDNNVENIVINKINTNGTIDILKSLTFLNNMGPGHLADYAFPSDIKSHTNAQGQINALIIDNRDYNYFNTNVEAQTKLDEILTEYQLQIPSLNPLKPDLIAGYTNDSSEENTQAEIIITSSTDKTSNIIESVLEDATPIEENSVAYEKPLQIILNNTLLSFDVPPQIIDDFTYVPMRTIFEHLGFIVEWDEQTYSIVATKGEDTLKMSINDTSMSLNGKEFTYSTAPTIVDSRTLIPLRALSETLGYDISWSETDRTIIIKK